MQRSEKKNQNRKSLFEMYMEFVFVHVSEIGKKLSLANDNASLTINYELI